MARDGSLRIVPTTAGRGRSRATISSTSRRDLCRASSRARWFSAVRVGTSNRRPSGSGRRARASGTAPGSAASPAPRRCGHRPRAPIDAGSACSIQQRRTALGQVHSRASISARCAIKLAVAARSRAASASPVRAVGHWTSATATRRCSRSSVGSFLLQPHTEDNARCSEFARRLVRIDLIAKALLSWDRRWSVVAGECGVQGITRRALTSSAFDVSENLSRGSRKKSRVRVEPSLRSQLDHPYTKWTLARTRRSHELVSKRVVKIFTKSEAADLGFTARRTRLRNGPHCE